MKRTILAAAAVTTWAAAIAAVGIFIGWPAVLAGWLALVALASFALAVLAARFALEGWQLNAATPWPRREVLAALAQILATLAYTGTVIALCVERAWR